MTVDRWLSERMDSAPPRLVERLRSALGSRVDASSADASQLFTDAANELLRELLARDSSGRDVALDLLTVDALATYAVEAASGHPASLGEYAAAAAMWYAASAALN